MALVSRQNPLERTIRPVGAYQLSGLACLKGKPLTSQGSNSEAAPFDLVALDRIRGYLLQINCASDNTTVLNPYQTKDFLDATGLALDQEALAQGTGSDTLWFCRDRQVYTCDWQDWHPREFVSLPYQANGVAVTGTEVYVSSQKAGYIYIFDRQTGEQRDKLPAPGVGAENLLVHADQLWVSDRTEQSVYCLDRATGEIRCRVLTPFAMPTGLAFYPDSETGNEILYVVYANEEPYIRDNPNRPESPLEITFRDRTFIHPLYLEVNKADRYALSNGYLIEMVYAEELSPLDEVSLENLEWRMALPSTTDRQKVCQVEPLGLPFTSATEDGQPVAVFNFKTLKPGETHIFGWKALIEVRGIKYQITPQDVEACPDLSPEFQARYLVDDDELAMDSEIVRRAAHEAVGTETNILRKILKIRNYVYDCLSYGIQPRIDTPDVVLERGVGSCGEYVGVLLALARLNGIACRTVGRYKCPPHPDQQFAPLHPDYNHVWLEFYLPGFGWVPMESNPDDVIDRGPYPTRFFMGLPWHHVELGKGIKFETTSVRAQGVRLGDLALNHVRFMILGELQLGSRI